MEEKSAYFTSEVTYDPLLFREYYQAFQDNSARTIIARLYLLFVAILLVLSMDNNSITKIFLVFAIVVFLSDWYNHHKRRDGGLDYKQMLHQFEGDIPHQLVLFREDQIVRRNMRSGNELNESYQNIRKIWETRNTLLLVTDLKLYHIVDKRLLTGGDSDELIRFLRKKCPKLKKIRRGGFGRLIRWLCWAVLAFGILWSILSFFHIPDKLAGKITNDMSYEEMAAALAELDITIDPAIIEELNQYDDEYSDFLYLDYPKVMNLLFWEGMGRYNYDTWEWTPSDSGVYWFDTEVVDAGAIYTNFLIGVDTMDETLAFSNITEDYSAVDLESGMGIVTFSFDYLGQTYTLNAQYQYDWFDTNMLFHLGRILNTDSDAKDLWYSFNGQGILLYYGTMEQMIALEAKAGIILLDPVNHPLYG